MKKKLVCLFCLVMSAFVSYAERYDYLDLSTSSLSLKKPAFKTPEDEKAWEALEGCYFAGSPRSTIPDDLELSETLWGMDYVFHGSGTYRIYYNKGKWILGGDGEAQEFVLDSISPDGKVFYMTSYNKTYEWKRMGDYLETGYETFYKYTGPDCYKKFLKEFVGNYNISVSKYHLPENMDKKVRRYATSILKAMAEGDSETVSRYVDPTFPIDITIGDYFGNTRFTASDLVSRTEDVQKAFDFMKADLKCHEQSLSSVAPVVNQFLCMSASGFESSYGEGYILVEYVFGPYEDIEMIFTDMNGILYLVDLREYAVFRP